MQNSKIEWTDHTFNPWWGCIRVSPGCEHCYAETLAHRYGHAVWGPAKTTPRREMSENYWKQPIKWNAAAMQAGTRARVFCASMADVFEDHPQLPPIRARLWDLIETTPMLDWLLLTKRPENFRAFLPSGFRSQPPPNVWLGTSVENQQLADKRIPYLLDVPAVVRFLSCEPLLGPLDLDAYLYPHFAADDPRHEPRRNGVEWVIVGGESGPGARPMHPDWARSLRDQAQAAGVPFLFKQHGEYLPRSQMIPGVHCSEGEQRDQPDGSFIRLGKYAAGRLLDGVEHNGMPAETRRRRVVERGQLELEL